MASRRKPMAADRTIDMFTGKSKVDMLTIGETSAQGADLKEEKKAKPRSLREDADRWLKTAVCADSSRNGNHAEGLMESVRITPSNDGTKLILEFMREGVSYRQLVLPMQTAHRLLQALLEVIP